MKNKDIDRDMLQEQKVIFCTECGVELQNFCFNGRSNNVKALKMNFMQCIKKGKFSGDFCSKLFIADNNNLDELWTNDT